MHSSINRFAAFVTIIIIMLAVSSCSKTKDANGNPIVAPNILIITKTQSFRHTSIEAGVAMFQRHTEDWKLTITRAEETAGYSGTALRAFDIVVLLNCTGDVFNDEAQLGLQDYVRSGGRILGIHACADAEYDWSWYGQMLGGRFDTHPAVQEATCTVELTTHPSTKELPYQWKRTDEWYNLKNLSSDNILLVSVNEATYNGGTMGGFHPISWCRDFDGGHVFYTAMGHTDSTFSEPLFESHIKGAIDWLMQY